MNLSKFKNMDNNSCKYFLINCYGNIQSHCPLESNFPKCVVNLKNSSIFSLTDRNLSKEMVNA